MDNFIKAGQKINFSSEGEDIFAQSNSEELETIFMHIIQNAFDASMDDNPVKITVQQDENYAIIKIKDSGHGMDQEFIRNELFMELVNILSS